MRAGTFVHSTMWGSYTTDCKIIAEKDDKYVITFWDSFIQQHEERTLLKRDVKVSQVANALSSTFKNFRIL